MKIVKDFWSQFKTQLSSPGQQFQRLLLFLVAIFLATALSGCEVHKASDMLYWGSVPNEHALVRLKRAGIKAVVNVRTNSEKGRAVDARKMGINFYHIQSGIVLTPEAPELKRYLKILADPKNRPVYVCCNIGIDRTSYFVAAYRVAIEHWTVRQAAEEMKAHGVKLWWWTFNEYDDSLRANEAAIRKMARELGCPTYGTSYEDLGPCPCMNVNQKTLAVTGPRAWRKLSKAELLKEVNRDSEQKNRYGKVPNSRADGDREETGEERAVRSNKDNLRS